jgi:hypothetical protein
MGRYTSSATAKLVEKHWSHRSQRRRGQRGCVGFHPEFPYDRRENPPDHMAQGISPHGLVNIALGMESHWSISQSHIDGQCVRYSHQMSRPHMWWKCLRSKSISDPPFPLVEFRLHIGNGYREVIHRTEARRRTVIEILLSPFERTIDLV